jgi:hypothetical protein
VILDGAVVLAKERRWRPMAGACEQILMIANLAKLAIN